MNLRKKLASLFLSGATVLAIATPVFADDVTTIAPESNGAFTFTKTLQYAEGVNAPEVTFNFQIDKVTSDAPDATVSSITFDSTDTVVTENGLTTATDTGSITFNQFPHAGVYEYTLREVAGEDFHYSYDGSTVNLNVYVENSDNGLVVKYLTVEEDGKKVDEIQFDNTYIPDNTQLKVSKVVTGNYGDKTKQFEFNITLTNAATADTTEYTATVGETSYTFTSGTEQTVNLTDGQELVFNDLPVGTTYTITEVGTEGYTPSVSVNGTDQNGSEGQSLTVSETKVVSGGNNVVFTNKYQEITPTGIIINNLPFIMLVVIGGAGIAFYMASKRRMNH